MTAETDRVTRAHEDLERALRQVGRAVVMMGWPPSGWNHVETTTVARFRDAALEAHREYVAAWEAYDAAVGSSA